MNTDVRIFEKVSPELDSLLRIGLATCWPQYAERFFKEGRILNGNDPLYTLVIFDDSATKIVAHCGLVEKEISCSKTPYSVAGLQQTFVLPEYRGQDLTQHLLRAFGMLAKLHKFDFSIGFARDGVCEFHRKAGWYVSEQKFNNDHRMVWKGVCYPSTALLPECVDFGGAIW